jgi:hypothetical protein
MLGRALERTAPLWPEVETGARWAGQATAILENPDESTAQTIWRRYEQWLQQLEGAAVLRESAEHFLKVTRSYGDDLFHCYRTAGLPRTNNALEQTFGRVRYHERRASGRKVASPSLVTDGSVRVPASVYTRVAPVTWAGQPVRSPQSARKVGETGARAGRCSSTRLSSRRIW